MAFGLGKFSVTRFASPVAASGPAAVVCSGAITIPLSVSGVGDHFAVPTVNINGAITYGGAVVAEGFVAISCAGAVNVGAGVVASGGHGVSASGSATIASTVRGRSYGIHASAAIQIAPAVASNGFLSVAAYGAISLAPTVSGVGTVDDSMRSGSGAVVLTPAVSGSASHGVAGAAASTYSPIAQGVANRGVSLVGAVPATLTARGFGFHVAPSIPLVSGFGGVAYRPVGTGHVQRGVSGSASVAYGAQVVARAGKVTGQGHVFIRAATSANGSHTWPIAGHGAVRVTPAVAGSGARGVFIGAQGGDRFPVGPVCSGVGNHG